MPRAGCRLVLLLCCSLVAEYAPFDLHLVLRDVAQLSWPLAHSKRLTFVYNVARDMPRWVVGDERRLMQMLLNVIGRAVECTPSVWGKQESGSGA